MVEKWWMTEDAAAVQDIVSACISARTPLRDKLWYRPSSSSRTPLRGKLLPEAGAVRERVHPRGMDPGGMREAPEDWRNPRGMDPGGMREAPEDWRNPGRKRGESLKGTVPW